MANTHLQAMLLIPKPIDWRCRVLYMQVIEEPKYRYGVVSLTQNASECFLRAKGFEPIKAVLFDECLGPMI